jgi:hypothetical protein
MKLFFIIFIFTLDLLALEINKFNTTTNSLDYKDAFSIDKNYEKFVLNHGNCSGKDCYTDRQRSERSVLNKFRLEKPNNIIWYDIVMLLDEKFTDISPANTSLVQVKLSGWRPPMWMLEAKNSKLYLHLHSSHIKCDIGKIDDLKSKWIDITFAIDYSTSLDKRGLKNSFVKLYLNNRPLVCDVDTPILTKYALDNNSKRDSLYLKYGIYNSFVSRWLYKNRTKNIDIKKWEDYNQDSKHISKSFSNSPFLVDWGVKLPTLSVYFKSIRVGLSYEDIKGYKK